MGPPAAITQVLKSESLRDVVAHSSSCFLGVTRDRAAMKETSTLVGWWLMMDESLLAHCLRSNPPSAVDVAVCLPEPWQLLLR